MAKLYFRYGAMGSSKTANALMVEYNYMERGKQALLVKPRLDSRDGDYTIRSRMGLEKEGIMLETLVEMQDSQIQTYDCIIVDEAQFASKKQVEFLVHIVDDLEIPVICYGLRTTFQTKLFEGSKPIMELADELEELITICKCGSRAKFQARKVNGNYVTEGGEVAIDGENSVTYESLCGKCYIEEVLGIHEL